jgi:glyoxylase-like metal-dependent hydrolase (beta-lactamase superfamily II)
MIDRILRRWSLAAQIVLTVSATLVSASLSAADLQFKTYNAQFSGIGEMSVLIMGEREAVLIDAQWLLKDGAALAEVIAASGRQLTHILLTHGHPDHYMGLAPIVARFPDARVLARAPVQTEIAMQFRAKWVHWQTIMGDQIPIEPVVPDLLEGDKLMLEGHEIRIVDLPPAETMDATAYYVPSAKVLIPGDLIFSKMHAYFADLNNPEAWIKALEAVRQVGPIETIYPGHGAIGGPELIDEEIAYMKVYQSIAKPGVPLTDFAPQMMKRFPDYGGALLLWWTRGPGYGAFGPKALGLPENLMKEIPAAMIEGKAAQ